MAVVVVTVVVVVAVAVVCSSLEAAAVGSNQPLTEMSTRNLPEKQSAASE
jgi:hypothetical protein